MTGTLDRQWECWSQGWKWSCHRRHGAIGCCSRIPSRDCALVRAEGRDGRRAQESESVVSITQALAPRVTRPYRTAESAPPRRIVAYTDDSFPDSCPSGQPPLKRRFHFDRGCLVSRMNPNTLSTSGVPRGESGTTADCTGEQMAIRLRIVLSIDGQPAVARVTGLRVASV
jgi:hypothetical protein